MFNRHMVAWLAAAAAPLRGGPQRWAPPAGRTVGPPQSRSALVHCYTGTLLTSLLSAGFGTTVSLFDNPLQISLSGTNLTDKVYINHLSRLKSEGIANMGRNISIGLEYTL